MKGVDIKDRVLYLDNDYQLDQSELHEMMSQFDFVVYKSENNQSLIWASEKLGGTLTIPDGVTSLSTKLKVHGEVEKLVLPVSLIPGLSYDLPKYFPNMSTLDLSKIEDFHAYTYAFTSCFSRIDSLKRVILNSNLQILPSYIFSECGNLEEINLPDTLHEIGDLALRGCKNLKHLKLPNSLESIGYKALSDTGLEELVIPDNVSDHDITMISWENSLKIKSLSIPRYTDIDFEKLQELETLTIRSTPKFFPINTVSLRMKNIAFLPDQGLIVSKYPISNHENYNLGELNNSEVGLMEISAMQRVGCNIKSAINIAKSYAPLPLEASEDARNFRNIQAKAARILMYNITYLFSEEEINKINMARFFQPKSLKFYFHAVEEFEKQAKTLGMANDEDAMSEMIEAFVCLYYLMGGFEMGIHKDKKISKSGKEMEIETNYAQKTGEFLKDKLSNRELDIPTVIQFYEMVGDQIDELQFSPRFANFVMGNNGGNNFKEIMQEERQNPGFFAKCCVAFDEFMEFNTSNKGSQRQLAPTVDKLKIFLNSKTTTKNPELQDLVRKVNTYFVDPESLDLALSIREEYEKNNISKSIIKKRIINSKVSERVEKYSQSIESDVAEITSDLIEIANEQYSDYSYELLDKDDPTNYILGKLCSCCAHLQGAGYGIMHASIVHPDVQNIVIKNDKGRIVAKSTLYINRNGQYGICNNVEVWSGVPSQDKDIIYNLFKKCVKTIAEIYNEENPNLQLKQINVGMEHNDLKGQIEKNNKESDIFEPLDYADYGRKEHYYSGDSYNEQYCIWRDEKVDKLGF